MCMTNCPFKEGSIQKCIPQGRTCNQYEKTCKIKINRVLAEKALNDLEEANITLASRTNETIEKINALKFGDAKAVKCFDCSHLHDIPDIFCEQCFGYSQFKQVVE